MSYFYEAEFEIWAGFGPVGSTENLPFLSQNRLKNRLKAHIELWVALEPVCCKKQQKIS